MSRYQLSLQLAVLAFLTFAFTLAHAATTPVKDTVYSVNLGLYTDVDISSFEDIRAIGYPYAEVTGKENTVRVFVSNYAKRSEAEAALEEIQKKPLFSDASLSEKPLSKGGTVYTVQLASHGCREFINWQNYNRAGNLFFISEGKTVKVVSGKYATKEEAKGKALLVQELGFDGAFIRETNSLLLHKVKQFNTIKDLGDSPTVVFADKDKNETGVIPQEEIAEVAPAPAPIDRAEFQTKGPTTISKSSRQSVKSLQMFLKGENSYSGSLDGVYGKGTASGVDMFSGSLARYKRYEKMAEVGWMAPEEVETSKLEQLIFLIETNPKEAYKGLTEQGSPLANAYRAYILYVSDKEKNKDKINNLMNEAIQTVSAENKSKDTPFDPDARYAYDDLEQLILHTRYIQSAMRNEPAVPCWLFMRHKKEAYSAFIKAENRGVSSVRPEDCGGFLNWESIILVKTISMDLNPNEGNLTEKQKSVERQANSERNRLFLMPRKLNTDQQAQIVDWNNKLWKTMDAKIKEDGFFAKFGVPFKLAYHKAWIQLEDHFMNQGFEKHQANALALRVLKAVIATDLDAYSE